MIKEILRGVFRKPLVGTTNLSNRISWVEEQLKVIPKGLRILDAGAGEQQYRKFCDHLDYVSQDIAEYDGKGDEGLQTQVWDYGKLDIVSDITEIPELDNSFDAILCTEVLEHVTDPAKVFGEFSRLLKPGGVLLLTAPFCSLTHFAPYHYSTGFSRYYYKYHLEFNKLRLIEITPNGNYFEYLAQEIHRLPDVKKIYLSKSGLGIVYLLASRILLHLLRNLSLRDKSSHELLCFGYHIRAIKNKS